MQVFLCAFRKQNKNAQSKNSLMENVDNLYKYCKYSAPMLWGSVQVLYTHAVGKCESGLNSFSFCLLPSGDDEDLF